MKCSLFLLLLICSSISFSQKKYPVNDFRIPVDIPIVLAGTFGELRSNHFHAGIDIKTQRKEGLPIYAAADGYVSRIKISLWGYGKVLYINHPNGYTTVYAHLSKFEGELESYIKTVQYNKQNYETGNVFPKKGEIPVKKGQIIAFSGSTGGFIAPHLHYEIRDTKTENIINPLLFGIQVKDSIAPKIKGLFAYPLTDSSRVNAAVKKTRLSFKPIGENKYLTDRITAKGPISFGIQVYDQLNNASNKNGIYSLKMKVNGHYVYHHDLETFAFKNSKYINLFIDYPHYARFKNKFQKTYIEKGNQLKIYKTTLNNGFIDIKNGYDYTIELIASDFKGNETSIKIPVKGVKSNTLFKQVTDTTAYKIIATQFHKFEQNGVTIAFPKNTFYKDVYLDFNVEKGLAKIHKPYIPLNKNYTLTFDVSKFTEEEKRHLYIANINNKKYPSYTYTKKKENKFYTTTKTLGNYTLKSDSQKPTIVLKNFNHAQWINKHTKLIVKIDDIGTGIKSFRATIDTKWVLMEYNLKQKTVTYDFNDTKLVGTKHDFKIEVEDRVGNTNTLNATFYKKQ